MHRTPLARYETAHGFILDWMVTGFFPNATVGGRRPDLFEPKASRHWRKDYLGPYGGEAAIRGIPRPKGICEVEWLPLRADARWPKLVLPEFRRAYPELDRAWPEKWDHCWYALAVIECDSAGDAELRLCGHDGCRVWFNGRFVFEEHSWHKLAFDLHTVPVRLRRGRNALLLKLDRFGLLARITDPRGRRLKAKARSLAPAEPRAEPPGTFEQLARRARTLKVTMPCRADTPAEFRRWRRAARAHFRRCLGPWPEAPRPRGRLVEEVRCNGYARRRYLLTREAGSLLPVYVLVPRADRSNGRTVICPHGHGQDDKVVAGLAPPTKPYGNFFGPFTGNYAEILARAGFLTATWAERALSFERRDLPFGRGGDPCNLAGLCAQAMGLTLPGLHLFDLHGVTDFVCSLPQADPKRLGVMGLSGGGTMTYLAGAFDERFRAVAPFCGCISYADYAAGRNGCGQQVVPGLFPVLDVGELLCLIAPRPLLLGQGRRDVTFSFFLLERFARQARRAYRLFGAAERVELHLYDGAHQVDADAAVDFFTRRL